MDCRCIGRALVLVATSGLLALSSASTAQGPEPGPSAPTGSNRRAVYLRVEILDGSGNSVAGSEWMFAPWYGDRPDDRAFLEEDKKRPDALPAMQADAQGPHEAPIRAGEERVLSWRPALAPGRYTARASLIYDLNRYNDPAFLDDQTEIYRTSLPIDVR